MTILVIILIVVTLLRWIDYLLRLGRVGETTAGGRKGGHGRHEGAQIEA